VDEQAAIVLEPDRDAGVGDFVLLLGGRNRRDHGARRGDDRDDQKRADQAQQEALH
jgi:hypothetical protein